MDTRIPTGEALREAHDHEERTSELAEANARLQVEVEERKRAEEALRTANERALWLARFPDENPNPVVRVSMDGTVLYCNPASENLHGWKCEVGRVLIDELFFSLINRAIVEAKEVQEDVVLGERFYLIWIVPFLAEGYVNIYGRDITARKRAEEELQKYRDELEMRVRERTEELEVMNEELKAENEERLKVELELRDSEADLRQLSAELLSAQEKERKLIANEIHDSLGASLAAVKFKLEDISKKMSNDNSSAKAELEKVIPILQGTIEEVRRIQMSLRPSMLDDLGILVTINWFCRQFETSYSRIHLKKEIDIQEHEIPESLKIVIYRVLQEALNNIAKHSNASVVLLGLRKAKQAIQLVVRDSGRGFDPEEAFSRKGTAKGLGLDSMRERAELSGGSFSIESNKGAGTVIRATWPIEQ